MRDTAACFNNTPAAFQVEGGGTLALDGFPTPGNTTQVMGTAVESLGPSEATALVYTNSVSTSPVSKNIPSLRYLSYRLTMERHDVDWLVTSMNAMTKLDLTPQQ